jgi:CheY-like chemotaxis protein
VLDPATGLVSADPDRIGQVVSNLVSNAIKFTPIGGRVDVRLARIGSEVCITVTDTGVGIAPEFVPHVFDRFSQADAAPTRAYAGLGLGLAIARHLVELHGGRLEATSRGKNQGAMFTVWLPAPLAGTGARGSEPAAFTEVTMDEALNLLARWRPDVLVSDIGMPTQNGYDLVRAVRRLAPGEGAQIPALAVTAYAGPEDSRLAVAAGFQFHLAKPIDPIALARAVANLAGRTAAA